MQTKCCMHEGLLTYVQLHAQSYTLLQERTTHIWLIWPIMNLLYLHVSIYCMHANYMHASFNVTCMQKYMHASVNFTNMESEYQIHFNYDAWILSWLPHVKMWFPFIVLSAARPFNNNETFRAFIFLGYSIQCYVCQANNIQLRDKPQ